jgi:hypothetical protein
MTRGYQQIVDGEWVEPKRVGHSQCCDCHMVHDIEYAVVDRVTREPVPGVIIQVKVKVNRRRTAASRRKLKFTKDD